MGWHKRSMHQDKKSVTATTHSHPLSQCLPRQVASQRCKQAGLLMQRGPFKQADTQAVPRSSIEGKAMLVMPSAMLCTQHSPPAFEPHTQKTNTAYTPDKHSVLYRLLWHTRCQCTTILHGKGECLARCALKHLKQDKTHQVNNVATAVCFPVAEQHKFACVNVDACKASNTRISAKLNNKGTAAQAESTAH